MDSPSKLFDLALKVVVDCYTTGFLQPKVIPPGSTVSDQIFEAVMRNRDYCYDAHTKALMKELKPSKLELNLKYCRQETFSDIRKLKLTELKIQDFTEISKYIVKVAGPPQRGKRGFSYSYSRGQLQPRTSSKDEKPMEMYCPILEHFCIAQFLGDILSEGSKRELRVLDISGHRSFEDKWMEVLSLMFPKLEELNIKGRKFSEEDFTSLCNNLPNLHTLHFGHSDLENLNGLSKLKNLKNLVIDYAVFHNKEDVEELFNLKNLKTLSLCHSSRTGFKYDYYFAKSFPEVTHLEIKFGDADFLRKILPKLPKLKVLVAKRMYENVVPPSVAFYTNTDLKTIIKSLGYFRVTGRRKEILNAIQKLWEMYRNWGRKNSTFTPDQITAGLNEVELLLEAFKFDKEVVEDVHSCVGLFARFATENANKLKIVSLSLKNLKNHLQNRTPPSNMIFKSIWLDVFRFTGNTENLNIDQIAALAMESIIYGGGDLYWEQFCAQVLEEILDDMDLSSEFYKKIEFRKLHECLSIIYKRDKILAETKVSVGEVIEFIELVM
ncbi:unnamed protein product [Caenorhabditis brenneri]